MLCPSVALHTIIARGAVDSVEPKSIKVITNNQQSLQGEVDAAKQSGRKANTSHGMNCLKGICTHTHRFAKGLKTLQNDAIGDADFERRDRLG
eukprot:6347184-Amphidinium_carterae.1